MMFLSRCGWYLFILLFEFLQREYAFLTIRQVTITAVGLATEEASLGSATKFIQFVYNLNFVRKFMGITVAPS